MVRVPIELDAHQILRADVDLKDVKVGDRLVVHNNNIVAVLRGKNPFPSVMDLNDVPLSVTQTKKGAIGNRIQQLIREGMSNDEIWKIIQPEFKMSPEKKSYITGQRRAMERQRQTELFPTIISKTPDNNKIIKLLQKKGPMTARQINKALQFPYGKISPTLSFLVKARVITPIGDPKIRYPEYQVVGV